MSNSIITTQTWKIGDCLELLPEIKTKSIDMILTDLPYGTTGCSWDTVIPFEPLWKEWNRIIKDKGAIVLTASQPFTSMLIMSNIKMFKYSWVWYKTRPSGHIHAKNKPLRIHEDVCVFSKGTTVHKGQSMRRMHYYPQGLIKVDRTSYRPSRGVTGSEVCAGPRKSNKKTLFSEYGNYPKSVIQFRNPNNNFIHPTEKPVALFKYFIKTYTHEGAWVHDSCLGSGTTLEACRYTNRNCIGFEIDSQWECHYQDRCKGHTPPLTRYSKVEK